MSDRIKYTNESMGKIVIIPDFLPSIVTPALMESAWQQMAVVSPKEGLRLQKLCSKEQEELTVFVSSFSLELRSDAAGLGLYAYMVMSHAFRRSRVKARKIRPGKITLFWNESLDFINEAKAKGYDRFRPEFLAKGTKEQAVMQYVVDVLAEETDDGVVLTDEEFWQLLRVLKTAADCLHDAYSKDFVRQ